MYQVLYTKDRLYKHLRSIKYQSPQVMVQNLLGLAEYCAEAPQFKCDDEPWR